MTVRQLRVVGRSIVVAALLLFVGLCVACAAPGASPGTGPTPIPAPAPAPTPAPTPAPAGPPFTIALASQGSTSLFTDESWRGLLSVTMDTTQISPPRPSRVTLNCGTGAALQELTGAGGLVTCDFVLAGTYRVSATASALTGFTASDATTVTATVRPLPPTPTPTPTPAPATPRVTINAGPVRCTTNRAFWAFNAQANVPIDHYEWEFGDGGDDDSTSREIGHEYSSDGFKTIEVEAKRKDNGETLRASVLLFIKFAAPATPTVCP